MLVLQEVEKPVSKDKEILVRIHASTVSQADCELRGLTLPLWTRIPIRIYMGYRKPRKYIPGMEFSGVIKATGKAVTRFKTGDEVFGSAGFQMGGNAEYNCYPENGAVIVKPGTISHEEAAAIPLGGLNALHFTRRAGLQPGQKILINGAGGSIGTFGIQLAKLSGAEVTAVDSTEKLDMMRTIGADHVIDYTQHNFWQNGEKYDAILDVVYGSPFSQCIRSLTEKGIYLMANPSPVNMLRGLYISKTTSKKVDFAFAGEEAKDLIYLADLVESGKIKPAIDRSFSLAQVASAHDYIEKGHKKGIITVIHNS